MATRYLDVTGMESQIGCVFNGSANSYIDVPAATAINNLFTSSCTFAFWINVPSLGTNSTIWSRAVNSSANRNQLYLTSSGAGFVLNFKIYNTVGTAFLSTTNVVMSFNTWYLVVGNWDISTKKITFKINDTTPSFSAQPALTGTPDNDSSASLRIGDNNGANGFIGTMDEISWFNTSLYSTYTTYLYSPSSVLIALGSYGDKSIYPYNQYGVFGVHLDENTGTTATDFMGNSNGTLGSAVTWTTFGRIFSKGIAPYNGHYGTTAINQYGSKTLSTSVAGNFTLSNWFKVYSTGSASDNYIFDLAQAGSSGVTANIKGSNKYLEIKVDGSLTFTVSTSMADNLWHNIVITRNGTTMGLWLDGVSQGTANVSTTAYPRMFLGNSQATNVGFYGYYDETCLWTRAVTNAEVADLYNNGYGMFYYPTDTFVSTSTTHATNILGAWHIDEQGTNGGTTFFSDSSGNGNHLTPTNLAYNLFVSSSLGGTLGTGVGSAQTWNTCRRRFQEFSTTNTFPGETIHVAKTPNAVAITQSGTPITGTFQTNPNGIEQNGFIRPITSASNASPIVLTVGTGHGVVAGDWILCSGIATNTSANGSWKVSSVDATHITLLNSKGNGAGTGGNFWSIKSRTVPLSASISYNLPRMRKAFWTQGTGVTLTDSFHMKSSCALTGTVNVAGAQNILWTDLGASTDLSAYSTINWDLWVGAVIPTTPNRLGIAFCSDASAAVPIVTYWCQPSQGATNWIKNVIPCGTTLPNNVRSIAIVSGGALNLSTCYFDTIWLSKAPSATDYIDGHSLIGISDAVGTKYYGIDQITDDTIFIGNQANAYVSTILTSWGWYGTSGTYNLYRRDTRKFQFTTNWLDMPGYINTPGTSASRINFECGYNIATDTQDGETWIANINGATGTAVLFNGTAASNTKLNRYCSAWINTGVNLSASDNIEFRGQFVCCSTGINCTALNSSIYYHAPNCGIAITCSSTKNTLFYAYSGTEIDCANSTTTNSVYFNGSVNTNFQDDIVANGGVGTNVLSLNVTYAFKAKKYTAKWCVSQPIYSSVLNFASFGDVDVSYGTWGGLALGVGTNGGLQYASNITFKSLTALTNGAGYGSYGLQGLTFSGCNELTILGGSLNGGYYSGIDLSGSQLTLKNFTNSNTVPYRFTNTGTNDNSIVYCEAESGVVGTNKIYSSVGLITNATDQRHTATGYSLKFSPTTIYATSINPMELCLGQFPVTGGVSNTIYAWMYRDNTGVTGKLVLKEKEIDGIASEVTSSITASAGNWEQVSISFTPTISGIVKVYAQVYGGTSYNLWIDDVNGDKKDLEYFAEPYYSTPSGGGGETSYVWC